MSKSLIKFGKVFIRSAENGEYVPLNSAYFSNADLKIYDESRDQLHPEYGNNVGANISLGWSFNCSDLVQNEIAEISGKFKLPLKLGEYPEPDLENLEKALEYEKSYCKKLAMLPEDKVDELVETSKISSLLIFCAPGRPILDQPLLLRSCPSVMFDDILETFEKDEGEGKRSLKISYKVISEIIKFGYDFVTSDQNMMSTVSAAMELAGIVSQDDGIPLARTMDFVNLGCGILDYARDFKDNAVEVGKTNGLNPDDIIKICFQTISVAAVEFSKEWQEMDKVSMIPSVAKVRQEAVGGVLLVEAIAYQIGIGLSDRVRENIFFKLIIENVKKITQQVNDVLSYKKEIEGKGEAGAYSNEVYWHHVGQNRPLEEVVSKLVGEVNEAMEQIEKLGLLLLQLYPEDDEEHEQVLAYLKLIKEAVTGWIIFNSFSKRYHEDLVFDCYIE